MKTLKESLLDNIETSMKNGDNLTKFGNHFTFKQLYGNDDNLLCINRSKLRSVIDGLHPFSDTIEAAITDFGRHSGPFGLSQSKKDLITNLVTAIENMTIPATNNLNDNKFKDDNKFKEELAESMTKEFQKLGIIPVNAKFHNDNPYDSKGDRNGVFQLFFDYKYNNLTFRFETK